MAKAHNRHTCMRERERETEREAERQAKRERKRKRCENSNVMTMS